MKNAEIRNLTDEELVEKVVAEKGNLQKLNFAHAISTLENPNQLGITKKLVARLKTETNARNNK